MASLDNIVKIINDLKVKGSSKGVSRSAIKKALGEGVSTVRVNNTLKKAVEAGKLIKLKESYKVPKPAAKPKKVVKKKTATKKAAPKKTATKKTVTKKKSAKKPTKKAAPKKKSATKKVSKKKTATKKKAAPSAAPAK